MTVKIAELRNGMSDIEVNAKVVEKYEERIVFTRFGKRRVCEFLIEDETGKIILVLWEENIDLVNVNDNISVSKCYVSSFKNKLQLNTTKNSIIKKI